MHDALHPAPASPGPGLRVEGLGGLGVREHRAQCYEEVTPGTRGQRQFKTGKLWKTTVNNDQPPYSLINFEGVWGLGCPDFICQMVDGELHVFI